MTVSTFEVNASTASGTDLFELDREERVAIEVEFAFSNLNEADQQEIAEQFLRNTGYNDYPSEYDCKIYKTIKEYNEEMDDYGFDYDRLGSGKDRLGNRYNNDYCYDTVDQFMEAEYLSVDADDDYEDADEDYDADGPSHAKAWVKTRLGYAFIG